MLSFLKTLFTMTDVQENVEFKAARKKREFSNPLEALLSYDVSAIEWALSEYKKHDGFHLSTKLIDAVDHRVRSSEYCTRLYGDTYSKVNLSNLATQFKLQDNYYKYMCFLSLSPNGYVRESALKEMAGFDINLTYPFLLLRLNDWVKKLNHLSLSILLKKIEDLSIETILNYPLFLTKLLRATRHDHSRLIDKINNRLVNKATVDQLLAIMSSCSRAERYFLMTIVFNKIDYKIVDYLDFFEGLNDPLITWKLFQLVLSSDKEFDTRDIRAYMLRSKSLPIRKLGIDALVDETPLDLDLLSTYLTDPSLYIRMYCQFHLKKAYDVSYLEDHYRTCLSNKNHVAGAILGLGDLNISCFEYLESYIDDVDPNVRKAVIYTLSKLDIERAIDHLFNSLKDPSSKVSKTSFKLLNKNSSLLDEDSWIKFFKQELKPSTLLRAFKLVLELSYFKSVLCLLHIRQYLSSALVIDRWQEILLSRLKESTYINFQKSVCDDLLVQIDHLDQSKSIDRDLKAILLKWVDRFAN